MEQTDSDSEAVCKIPRIQPSDQRLTIDVTTRIKQEVAEDHWAQNPECFSETRANYRGDSDVLLTKVECDDAQAYINGGLPSTISQDEQKCGISTKLLTSTIKPVKNEDDQDGNGVRSVFAGPGSVTPSIEVKQEAEWNLTADDHMVSSGDKETYGISTELLTSMTKPVKNEEESGPRSMFPQSGSITILTTEVERDNGYKVEIEEHALYKFEPGFGKQVVCDDEHEHRRHAKQGGCSGSGTEDTAKPYDETLVNTCKVKAEHDTNLVGQAGSKRGSQVDVFVCSRCNYSATEKDCLARHMKKHRNGTVRKCSTNEPQKNLSVHARTGDFATKRALHLSKHISIKHDSDAALCRCAKCDHTTKWKGHLSKRLQTLRNGHPECERTNDQCKPYKCPRCDYANVRLRNVVRHLKDQHDPNAKVYECTDCDYTTRRSDTLHCHVNRKHNSGAPVYQCTQCDFTTKTRYCLVRHAIGKHSPDAPMHQCTMCDYKATQKGNLSQHVEVRHNKHAEPHKCPHCDYSDRYKRNLGRHLKAQHNPNPEVYKCAYCDLTTKRSDSLQRHVARKHSSDGPMYQCGKCSYTTKWKNSLSVHIKALHHRRVELYKCPHCDHASKDKHSLGKHVKVQHDPEARRYECASCDFTTKHAPSLRKHVARKHKGDVAARKRAKCPHCAFATEHERNLSRHLKREHDPNAKLYECTECGFTTKWRSYLIVHATIKHDRDAPVYQCGKCSYVSKQKANLSAHIKAQHKRPQ